MDKLQHQPGANGDLAPWEADLAQRLASLRDLPTPPSLAPEATEQFLRRLRVQPMRTSVAARRPVPVMRIGLRFAAILLACVLGLSSVGYATATSLPGDPLYRLKRQVETAQLAVSPAEQQPGLVETLADRRLDEVAQLVGQHASEARVDAGVAEYEAAAVAFGRTAVPDKVSLFQRHLAVLSSLEASASDQTRTALQTAQRAAQAQMVDGERVAPEPTTTTPRVLPSQTPTITPVIRPNATTVGLRPTVSNPPMEQPTVPAPQPAAASPTATSEVAPPATPLAATAVPQAPRATLPPTAAAAPATPAPVHRASPQPTRKPSAPPQPSAGLRKTEQPGGGPDPAQPTPQDPNNGPGHAPATPQDPNNGPGHAPATPQDPNNGPGQVPPQQTAEPHNPGAPPAQATSAPRATSQDTAPAKTAEPPAPHNPPSAPTADKPRATEKPGSGGSQPPPSSGGSNPRPPGQPPRP